MTIKEIEERTGMDRANIRFYEKEGLLTPERLANGYRDYTEQDAETLLRIKLLRSLHVPLEDIRALQRGEKTLTDAMYTHLHTLEAEASAVAAAESVCRAMQEDRADYSTLDAGKYLTQLQNEPRTQQTRYLTVPKEDTAPHPAHPWRRYFARSLDYNLYLLPLELFCLLVLHLNPNSAEGKIASFFCAFLAFLMMLFIEPALLHLFGTTPGKWIFGLYLTDETGVHLSYEEGLRRTWNVFRYGYGFGVPLYDIYRKYKCYKLCIADEPCAWDEFPMRRRYIIRDTKLWRDILWAAAVAVLTVTTLWAEGASALPPNRGELTVAEFAENYNYLVDYYSDTDWIFKLMPNGEWAYHPEPSEFTFYYGGGRTPPRLRYTTDENGCLTGFEISEENCAYTDLPDSDDLGLTALAFIAAQPQAHPFADTASRVMTRLPKLMDVQFTVYGITVSQDFQCTEDDVTYTFTVTKEQ